MLVQAARGSCLVANALWEEERFGEAALASLRAHHTARETAIHVATGGLPDIVGTRALFKSAPLERASGVTCGLHLCIHVLHSFLRLVADADVDGQYAPKQKYGALVEKPKTWADLGLDREPLAEPRTPPQSRRSQCLEVPACPSKISSNITRKRCGARRVSCRLEQDSS